MDFFENIAAILKSTEVKQYVGQSSQELGKLIFQQDIEAGIELVENSWAFFLSIPNLIFLDKFKRFFGKSYKNYAEQVKMASKFNEDDEKYVNFVKKQLYILNEMEDDKKIDYYSNLTRACLLEYIDIPLYFKLVNILRYSTNEELEYLHDSINNTISGLNIFIDSFLGNGLVKMTLATVSGENEYKYTQLARLLFNYGIVYGTEEYISTENMTCLFEVEVIEPKTSSPFSRRENGNISICMKNLEKFK